MKNEKFDGVIESAYNKPLSALKVQDKDGNELPSLKSLKFAGDYDKFENISDVRGANEYPKDSEIVDIMNAKRKAQAVAKARQEHLDNAGVVKPTLENDDQLRLKKYFELLIASKKTHDEACDMAETLSGAKWDVRPVA